MIVDPRSSKWCFELAILYGFDSVMCQHVIGQEFFLSINVPSRLIHTHTILDCGKGMVSKMDFNT